MRCFFDGRKVGMLLCSMGALDYWMLIRTVHALLILRGITGRPGIAKTK